MDKNLVPADYIAIGVVLAIICASIWFGLFLVLIVAVVVWAIIRVISVIKNGRKKN